MANTQKGFQKEDAEDLLHQLKEYYETQRDEWSKVLNQWKSLESTWQDKQYQKFEPLFEKLSFAYSEAEKDCEKYIAFIQRRIKVEEQKEDKLGNL